MRHSVYPERDYGFGLQILTLRTETKLTQLGLADLLGISRQAIGDWEAGTNYPSPRHLRRLIELFVQHDAFQQGQEADEIRALWQSAQVRVTLDEIWLAHLLEQPPDAPGAPVTGVPSPALSAEPPELGSQVDWGDAREVSSFYGRETELARLTDWLLAQRCRVVSLLGMGGIGKTMLAARLIQVVAPHFERVYWRSLRDAPPPGEWLDGAIARAWWATGDCSRCWAKPATRAAWC